MRFKIKSLFLYIILTLALFSTNALADVQLNESSTSLELLQGQISTFSIEVTNTGTQNATLFFSNTVMEDNDDDDIKLTYPNEGTIVSAGASASISINVDVSKNMDIDKYSSTITISDTDSGNSTTFNLTVLVEPGVCDSGIAGNALKIDIRDPDSSDDFNPGNTIKIRVDVDNDGNVDLRVQVEAFLFDEDGIIEDASSSEKNIEEDEDETFEFDLEIPTDNTDIDDDESYTLLVKAFEDEDEDKNCIQDSVSIDIELEKHDVVMDEKGTRFIPEALVCGESTTLSVNVINVGESEESVVIDIENNLLGISASSDAFLIEDFNSDKEDSQGTKSFDINIPSTTIEGIYEFLIKATYSGKQESINLPLQVFSCDGVAGEGFYTGDSVIMSIVSSQEVTIQQAGIEFIHASITNNAEESKVLFVSLEGAADFAEATSKTITLDAFQTSNAFLPLKLLDNVASGKYTAIIELSDGQSILKSETITIEVPAAEALSAEGLYDQFTSGLSNLSSAQLLVINIILLIIIAGIIILLKTLL
tara:strand:- start:4299 stop:5903 length:1605 start_codon:yes stop_codon:yes gene_type:complete